jgi:hypothetical protein
MVINSQVDDAPRWQFSVKALLISVAACCLLDTKVRMTVASPTGR